MFEKKWPMKYNLPGRVVREIAAFAGQHDIQQVILFGSRARGTHTDRSDIDIAVAGGDFDGFYWDVKERIHSLLMFDIVRLEEASEELKAEVAKDGIRLYEKNR